MQNWEYRIVAIVSGGITKVSLCDSGVKGKAVDIPASGKPGVCESLARYLNGLGTEGWELVAADGINSFVLKRPKA